MSTHLKRARDTVRTLEHALNRSNTRNLRDATIQTLNSRILELETKNHSLANKNEMLEIGIANASATV